MRIIQNPKELLHFQKLKFYTPIAMVFVSLFLVVNIVTQKIIPLGHNILLTAGDFVYPLNYSLSIILVEVYGYAMSRRVIWLSFICNFIVVIIIIGTIALPSTLPLSEQKNYSAILGQTPRFLLASFVAFLSGEFIGTYVLAKIKILTSGKYLFFRVISATSIGQLVDSVIFGILAFVNVINWHDIAVLIICTYLFKIMYQALITPVIELVAKYLKKHEHVDIFDRNTDFNPFEYE